MGYSQPSLRDLNPSAFGPATEVAAYYHDVRPGLEAWSVSIPY